MKDRLNDLLSLYVDGRTSVAETAELEALLRESEAARSYYCQYLDLHASLTRNAETTPQRLPLPKRLRHVLPVYAAVAAASIMLIGVVWYIGARAQSLSSESETTASSADSGLRSTAAPRLSLPIVAEFNSVWRSETLISASSAVPLRGKQELISGFVAVDHPNARLVFEGPCQFSLAEDGLSLDRGRVYCSVYPGATDFYVETDHGTVLDVGTAFGLMANVGSVQCWVRHGSVYLVPPWQEVPASRDKLRPSVRARQTATFAGGNVVKSAHSIRFVTALPKQSGIVAIAGDLALASQPNAESKLQVVAEGDHVLPRKLPLSLDVPGQYESGGRSKGSLKEKRTARIPYGQRISSYVIKLDNSGATEFCRRAGSVTFARPVLGIAHTKTEILASEEVFGRRGISLTSPVGTNLTESGDYIALSKDRRTVTVDFRAINIDYIRVFTDPAN